ncbi:hypothetical protein [Shewanella woodyi]|nr:hypothetical protein [Shewanella woodyi]
MNYWQLDMFYFVKVGVCKLMIELSCTTLDKLYQLLHLADLS